MRTVFTRGTAVPAYDVGGQVMLADRNPRIVQLISRGLILSLCLAVSPALTAQVRAARLAFVINSLDASVSLLDVDRMSAVRRVPSHINYSTDSRVAYISLQ